MWLRLATPDEGAGDQRKNHDGPDQSRFRKSERYSRDGPTSGPADFYYGDQSDHASFALDVVMRARFVIPAQPLIFPT